MRRARAQLTDHVAQVLSEGLLSQSSFSVRRGGYLSGEARRCPRRRAPQPLRALNSARHARCTGWVLRAAPVGCFVEEDAAHEGATVGTVGCPFAVRSHVVEDVVEGAAAVVDADIASVQTFCCAFRRGISRT